MKKKILEFKLFGALALICMGSISLLADEFPFTPPSNFTLKPKYIVVHHPVTTKHVAAQLYFDQGLTLIYAFNHDAAYWSFLKASEQDPQMAMAYWGMALAVGANINMEITPNRAKTAHEYIQKAIELSSNASESERDYIQALAHRYPKDTVTTQSAQDYMNAMSALMMKYPDDLDCADLFAESVLDVNPWNQWTNDGKPLPGTMKAVRALRSVLKRDPQNLGANHYYIHAIEASQHPERALICADRLKTLMPASGHLLHMSSHIYFLVGDYHQAALSNEAAVAQDREYINEYGSEGIYPIHYLSHNLHLLSRAYSMEGNFSNALRAAGDASALYTPHFHRMPELEYYAASSLLVLMRFQKWDEVLKFPQPNSKMLATQVLWHFGRALAFVELNEMQKALKERQLFLEGKEKLPADLAYGYNKAKDIMSVAELVLDGKIAEKQGQMDKAINLLQKAVAAQDALHYNEPPDWFFPIRESLGGILLRANRVSDAELVFREDLKRHPRSGRSLFGLRECLSLQSRWHDYYWINKEYQLAWLYSDTQLSVEDL